jgi:cytosine/uracil/thiamine/allantoin permease
MVRLSKVTWILIGSIIGMLAYAGHLIYHYLMGELEAAIGDTPLETSLHFVPLVILVIFFLVSLWKLAKKESKVAWMFTLIGSIIGLLAFAGDLIYHISTGELQEAIGDTPLETALHAVSLVIFVVFFLVSLSELAKRE